ncbi:MAG TPA: hypothetical protein VFS67_22370 [Polyangiaceae bacterium]|jgi:hypothetical protein|nr:hypothetical protein [Polyangiaceae bacterium]
MSNLWHSFQEGGWAMYIIFALGLPGVGAAGRFAWRGEHQLRAFLRWIVLTLVATGAFGFSIDVQATLRAVVSGFGEPGVPEVLDDHRLALLLMGTQESLNCISGAFLFVVVIGLLGAVGHRRFPLPNPSAVPR